MKSLIDSVSIEDTSLDSGSDGGREVFGDRVFINYIRYLHLIFYKIIFSSLQLTWVNSLAYDDSSRIIHFVKSQSIVSLVSFDIKGL